MDILKLKSVISMLQSPDKENHIVALTIIEQQDYEKSFVSLILAYKFGNSKKDIWEVNAPNAFNFIQNKIKIVEGKGVTFNDIFNCIIKYKLPTDEMQLFMQVFSDYLTKQCHSLGYNFIEEIEMNIKLKIPQDV